MVSDACINRNKDSRGRCYVCNEVCPSIKVLSYISCLYSFRLDISLVIAEMEEGV